MSGKSQRVRSSVRLAALEGIPGAAVQGIINNFLVPCALALKASTFEVGLVGAIPNMGAALAQIKAPSLVDRLKSPKRVLLVSVALGILPWVAMAATMLSGSAGALWLLIAFSMLALILFHLPNAAWGLWISALTTGRIRGRVLGFRAVLAAVSTMLVFFAGGVLLDLAGSRALIGFAAIFATAAALRAVSYVLIRRMHEPARARRHNPAPGLRAIARSLPRSSMGRFLAYYWVFIFGWALSGPFFAVYLLRDLGFSYTAFTVVMFVPSLTGVAAPYLWGRWADRRGNIAVLAIASWGVAVLPVLWVFSHAAWWIIGIQLCAGAVWAGFNLITVNHVYNASSPDERTTNIACLYVSYGAATFLGNFVGGAIAPALPALNGNSLLTLFAISGGMRGLASLLLLPRVKERPVPSLAHASTLAPHVAHDSGKPGG